MEERNWEEMQKWMELKAKLNESKAIFHFKEGEVWWAAVGKNVGIEINGKGNGFARPVLIYKKLSKQGFLGLALTTQRHGGSWYQPLIVDGKQAYVVLSQVKTMSVFRLYRRIDKISPREYALVERKFDNLYKSKKFPQTVRNGVIQDIPDYVSIVAQMKRTVKRFSGWILRKMARRKQI